MRRYLTLSAVVFFLLCISTNVNSQNTGDYRSAATGNWSAAATWERFDGANWIAAPAAPSNADGAITLRNTHTVTINSVVNADQLTVDAGAILSLTSTLTLANGTGTDLVVVGNMEFSTGTLGGTGTATIDGLGTLTLNGAGSKTINAALTINGTLVWNDGTIGGSGAIVNNGTMTMNGNDVLNNSSTFTNTGTMTKQTGIGTTTISPNSWSNSGTININSGTLTNGITFTNTGSVNISNATWINNSTFNHNTGSQISGSGNFENVGVLTLNVPQVFPATLLLGSSGTINGAGNLTINNDFTIEGNITGTGTLTINANTTWLNGTLGRALTIANGQTLTLNTAGAKSMNAALTINGTMIWNDGTIAGSGAIVNNGTMTINGDDVLNNSSTFTNTGTMTKQTGIGTTIISPNSWNNSGTININSGTLTNGITFTNTGSINLNNTTWINNSTFNHNTGSQISGSGNFNNAGVLTLNIPQIFAASLVFSSTATINGAGDLTINNDFTIEGNITGTGALTINANSTWLHGTLGRALTIANGQTLTLNTAGAKSMNAALTINGTMIWNDGTIGGSGAIVNNGTMTINGDDVLNNSSTFTNTGTVTKQTGIGTTIISPNSWNNSGTININSGTLTNGITFTNTGSINMNNTTWINNSTFNHNTGSQISGSGNFNNAGVLVLNISQVFPASLVFSSTATINGAGDLTINNDFTIEGSITGIGTLTINANTTWLNGLLGRALTIAIGQTLTLNTAASKSMNAALTINGTMIWNDGTIGGSGAIVNNGTLTINGDDVLNNSSTFTNTGTMTKQTGNGTSTISPNSWSNSGTISINSGILTSGITFTNEQTGIIKGIGIFLVNSTFTNNGTIAPGLSPGILTVNGTNPFDANSKLSIEIAGNGGAGQPTGHDQLQRAENLTLNGTLNVAETGTIPDGDYIIILLTSGTITGTFSSTNLPANYSVIYNNNNVVVRKGSACPPSVTIAANPGGAICPGTNVTFTATPTNGGTPTYQWKLNGNNVGTNSNTYQNAALVNGDAVICEMTSSLGCANPSGATSNQITMIVNATVIPSVSIAANPGNTICTGANVIFTATPTNGGASPSYQWKLNGNNVGGNSNTYSNNSLANTDAITCVMTSNATCPSPATATSNQVTMTVNPTVTPSVSVGANPGNTICSGTNVIFTATPTNGGASPSYQWKLNGNNVGTNSNTYSNNALAHTDVITCVMTSNATCPSPVTATSNQLTMTVNQTVTPSVSIAADPGNTICTGTNVTVTATPTNGGATPSYQWKLNGNNVGTNSNSYSNNALVDGDVITVVMTSSQACASPTTATSTGITMEVTAAVAPSVSIAANPGNTICSGTNVTFTATPTNGGTPSYQWKLNGNNVGANSNTYQNSTLVNGDMVTVVMTSSLACASPTTATSTGITMVVTSTVAPSVSIAANPGNTICTGTNVTFTATPTNGGATPSYQWKLNGINVGTNSNSYSNNALVDGDVITVVMTSSLACTSPATATSTGITMAVTSTVAPSVSIAANPGNTICTGTNVTFTATPTNGGASPSYQWKLNGNNVGTNSNSYSNNALVDGDVITVVMTSSLACASPTTATSTGITMVVTSTVAPLVSIAANPGNTICSGTNVTFNATSTNGGATPSYQWKINGNNVGANSNTYQNSTLVNGDVVTVVMTSSLACASPTTATSTAINMVVTATVTPSVSTSANPGNTICAGTNVTFTATSTNGGTPSYQWKLNGNNVGTNSNTYQNASLANGDVVTVLMTSSIVCASPNPVTSNSIVMSVSGAVAPSVSISANPGNTICTGTNVTFTATPTNGGATPSYQWKLNGNNVGTNSNSYSNNALVDGDVITVVMTSLLACANPTTATSTGITMVVTSTVAPSVSIAANPGNTICSGTNVTFSATPTNGGNPSYQWKLNGNNVGANSNSYQNSTLVNGDVITVVMTSSLACASPTTTTSNAINMVVTATATPSVSISANPGNTICAGTNVTFTAAPTNGGMPSYQWKLNGNNVGTNSNTYQNASLANGDVVTVVMTSSLACASPGTATSNAIAVIVTTLTTFYIDSDGDGYGNPAVSQQACTAPSGYVADNTDCNDNSAAVNPAAAEICGNNIDDNCNDQTDENCTADLPVITLRTYPVKEGNAGVSVFDVEVKLDRPAPLQVRVNYATSNDDAIAGLDYVATQGVLTIPVGATSAIVRVSIIGDLIRENNERFLLNFSNPVNVIIEGDGRSRIMIIDDDKGKPNVRADNEIQSEQLPGMIIPNVIPRNHIWTITGISEMKNEVIIMNMQGQVIFRANNYKNNIPIGNISTGFYVYKIKVAEKDNKVSFYTGKLFVTE